MATWRNRTSPAASLRMADPSRISGAPKRGALFPESRNRPQQVILSPIGSSLGRSSGQPMTAASIRRLSRRYGLTLTQARLVVALHYGGNYE